jgi:hypothetical protein
LDFRKKWAETNKFKSVEATKESSEFEVKKEAIGMTLIPESEVL